MSKLFRSEEMNYYSLAMPRENAWDILNDLGEISSLQFIDQHPNVAFFTRPFANFIRRCEEMKLKLDFIEEKMNLFGNSIKKCEDYEAFLKHMHNILSKRDKAQNTYFEELEVEVLEKHDYLNNQISNFDNITQKLNTLLEYRSVLLQAAKNISKSKASELELFL